MTRPFSQSAGRIKRLLARLKGFGPIVRPKIRLRHQASGELVPAYLPGRSAKARRGLGWCRLPHPPVRQKRQRRDNRTTGYIGRLPGEKPATNRFSRVLASQPPTRGSLAAALVARRETSLPPAPSNRAPRESRSRER